MDKPVWDLDFTYNGPLGTKVSCHAGDFGVRAFCNIMGDQPLFYIEDSSEEEDILSEDLLMMNLGINNETLDKMRAKIQSYDKAAKSLASMKIELREEIFDRVVFKKKTATKSLKAIIDFGLQSGIFKSYFDFIISKNIKIELCNHTQQSFYNRDSGIITVNPLLGEKAACRTLIQSMRMAWNHKNGLLINPLSFQPEEAILVNRLIHADLDVTLISYLWDMKLAGYEDIWNKEMNSANYDLCSAYAMEAMTDFRSIKSGLAARATFEKWFLSGRCKNFDREIIQTMLGCHTDIEISSSDASRVVAIDIVAGLGNRPMGRNYLSAIVTQIMTDTMYSEVRDRSNANFLWFITFERRMNEVEQNLHTQDMSINLGKDNVISMPQKFDSIQHVENAKNAASIFFLDHFRAQ